MKPDGPFGQFDWKSSRMRSFFLAALNCRVRNKPRVAAAPKIASARVTPARDVALVLVRNAEREAI